MQISKNLVAIPLFNEEENIKNLIQKIPKRYDVLIINDFSTDKSLSIIKEIKNKNLKIINNNCNLGYDKCIRKVYEYFLNSHYSKLCTIDGDFEHNPKYLEDFFYYLDKYDCVIGNRNIKNRYSEYITGFIYSIFFGINDPLCGMKGYNKIKYKNIQKKNTFGMAIMNFFLKNKYKIKSLEIENNQQRQEGSKIGFGYKIEIKILLVLIDSLKYILLR